MTAKTRAALPRTLWVILAVTLALRLVGAWRANLTFDERAHLALSDTISLQPGHLHLVSRSLDHPFLSIYILKISSLLFGSSDFSLRIFYVLAGTLTVLCIYSLGRRVFGQRAGLWAAALLAVDQFHFGWSRVFMPEVWLMLFATLVLWQCLRTLEDETTRNFVTLGALLGLAYLAKEPGILLVPALWLVLLATPRSRRWLWQPRWYLAHVVLLLVILPDLAWNMSQWTDSYLHRGAAFLSEPFKLSLKSFSLYIGELFLALRPNVLDSDYYDGGLYVCHWVAGVLYLAGVTAALPRWREVNVRLLLATFVLVFGVFTLLPGGTRFDPFWWASISLIPAVVCAGWLLDRVTGGAPAIAEAGEAAPGTRSWPARAWRRPIPGLVAVTLTVYLALHDVPLAWKPGPFVPRPTVADLVRNFTNVGNAAVDRGLLDMATLQYIYVLNIGGPNRDAYIGLARIAELRGDRQRADALRARSAELDQTPAAPAPR